MQNASEYSRFCTAMLQQEKRSRKIQHGISTNYSPTLHIAIVNDSTITVVVGREYIDT